MEHATINTFKAIVSERSRVNLLRAIPKSINYDRMTIERSAVIVTESTETRGSETVQKIVTLNVGKYPLGGFSIALNNPPTQPPTIVVPTQGQSITLTWDYTYGPWMTISWVKQELAYGYQISLFRLTKNGVSSPLTIPPVFVDGSLTSLSTKGLYLDTIGMWIDGHSTWRLEICSISRRGSFSTPTVITFTTSEPR